MSPLSHFKTSFVLLFVVEEICVFVWAFDDCCLVDFQDFCEGVSFFLRGLGKLKDIARECEQIHWSGWWRRQSWKHLKRFRCMSLRRCHSGCIGVGIVLTVCVCVHVCVFVFCFLCLVQPSRPYWNKGWSQDQAGYFRECRGGRVVWWSGVCSGPRRNRLLKMHGVIAWSRSDETRVELLVRCRPNFGKCFVSADDWSGKSSLQISNFEIFDVFVMGHYYRDRFCSCRLWTAISIPERMRKLWGREGRRWFLASSGFWAWVVVGCWIKVQRGGGKWVWLSQQVRASRVWGIAFALILLVLCFWWRHLKRLSRHGLPGLLHGLLQWQISCQGRRGRDWNQAGVLLCWWVKARSWSLCWC